MDNKTFLDRGYTVQTNYSELFWKFPQFLLKNNRYKNLKDSSKIAYMLFKDRLQLAVSNNWFDENGIVYLLFSQKEMMDLLNCYQGKVRSTITDLQNFDLLIIEQGKFNPKVGKNEPNKYFLLQPEYTINDIYYNGDAQIARRIDNEESSVINGDAQIARRNILSKTVDITGDAQIAHDKDISINQDTLLDTSIDTKKQQQEEYLLSHFAETYKDRSFLNEDNLNLIALFSDNLRDAENIQGILLRAKKAMEKEHNATLVIDETYIHNEVLDIQGEIAKTLRRIYHKRQTDSSIENIDNYAFGAFRNLFDSLLCQLRGMKEQSNATDAEPLITLHNWLES